MTDTYFAGRFGSDEPDLAADWIAVQYGKVDFDRRFQRYTENIVGDERFLLSTVQMSGQYNATVDPELVVIASTSVGFRWEVGGESGDHAEPVLFQPGKPYLAKVADSEIHAAGLRMADLTRTARLLYGDDRLEPTFEGARPTDAKRARLWQATLEMARSEAERGLLANPIVRSSTYRLLAVSALESFRLAGEPAERRASAAQQEHLHRRARQYFDEHAAQPITVDDAAVALRASVPELVSAFAWHENCTPDAYLRRVRLQLAHEELASAPLADEAAGDVAARWGFTDVTGFLRARRRRFGWRRRGPGPS